MKTTPIYGLPYIEADDLVSSAPAQFKTMAEGIETALTEVDSRNTPAGVKPVIATTLEALAAQTGVTGQTGYVTADTTTANNGPYYYNGTAWLPYATGAMLDSLRNQLTQGYEFGVADASTDQNGVATVNWVRHSKSPQVMLVMLARTSSDDLNRFLSPMVYELTNNGAQVRFRRNDSNAWAGNQPTKFYWLALWK